jgi:hypothetical protein
MISSHHASVVATSSTLIVLENARRDLVLRGELDKTTAPQLESTMTESMLPGRASCLNPRRPHLHRKLRDRWPPSCVKDIRTDAPPSQPIWTLSDACRVPRAPVEVAHARVARWMTLRVHEKVERVEKRGRRRSLSQQRGSESSMSSLSNQRNSTDDGFKVNRMPCLQPSGMLEPVYGRGSTSKRLVSCS